VHDEEIFKPRTTTIGSTQPVPSWDRHRVKCQSRLVLRLNWKRRKLQSIAVLVKDSGFLSALQEQLRIDYQAERDRIIASANGPLSCPPGNGFRGEGRISSAGVAKALLLANGLRLDLRAAEDLVLALAKIAAITIDIRNPLFLSIND
jgi:hypothetical protein